MEVIKPFLSCTPSEWGSTIKGKSLLPQAQIFSFKSRAPFGRAKL